MARIKKTASSINAVKQRLQGLKSISGTVNLPQGLTTGQTDQLITDYEKLVADYNQLLSTADDMVNRINKSEKDLDEIAEKILLAVKLQFGKDSSEYEMVGGTRLSERSKKKAAQEQTAVTN